MHCQHQKLLLLQLHHTNYLYFTHWRCRKATQAFSNVNNIEWSEQLTRHTLKNSLIKNQYHEWAFLSLSEIVLESHNLSFKSRLIHRRKNGKNPFQSYLTTFSFSASSLVLNVKSLTTGKKWKVMTFAWCIVSTLLQAVESNRRKR